jgi:hypothetical protein
MFRPLASTHNHSLAPPPRQTVTVRVVPSNGNSSTIVTQQIWLAPDLLRANVDFSDAPFPLPVPGRTSASSYLQNATSGESWSWVSYAGQTFCNKDAGSSSGGALCVGGNLALNSSRVMGGSQVFSWVGFQEESADNNGRCWNELLINSEEETDPARWLSSTSQCTRTAKGAYDRQSVESVSFSDFSTAPFPPGTFDLPKECPQ